MTTVFTAEQKNIMNELANFIQLKGLKIESKKDMDFAFSQYLQNNATNFYFKADEFEKDNFSRVVKQNIK